MPKQFNIPGHGLISFPDSWSYNQIIDAVKSGNLPKDEPLQAQGAPGLIDRIAAQVPTGLVNNRGVTAARGLALGAADPVVGAGQLAVHLLGSDDTAKKFDTAINKVNEDYQRERGASAGTFDPARLVGNLGAPANIFSGAAVKAAGIASPFVKGLVTSGLETAMEPVIQGGKESESTDDYAARKMRDVGLNMAAGALLGPLSKKVMTPISEAVGNRLQGTWFGQNVNPVLGALGHDVPEGIVDDGTAYLRKRAAEIISETGRKMREKMQEGVVPAKAGTMLWDSTAPSTEETSPGRVLAPAASGPNTFSVNSAPYAITSTAGDIANRPLPEDPEERKRLVNSLAAFAAGA